MKIKDKSRLFRTSEYILLALSVLAILFWLGQFNLYHVIYYQEQMQLFRFDGFYFHSYWITPGGVAGYLGAFFTQFFFYPWIGAVILSLALAGVYLLLDSISRRSGKVEYLFAALFIPTLLLMMVLTNQHFHLSYFVGLIISLAAFRAYIVLKTPARTLYGFIMFVIVYSILAALLVWAILIPFFSLSFCLHGYAP